MSAVTIPNPLPADILALSSDTVAMIADIEHAAANILIVATADDFARADTITLQAIKLDKAIEAERKRLKAPITELANRLDEASGEARAGLLAIKARLGAKILAYTTAENARREEERRRLEEQRRMAEEQERQARAIAEHNRREAERAAAEAKATSEEVAPWDDPAPAPIADAIPALIPTVERPTIEQQMATAPIKSSSVVQKTIKRVEIVDASLVPKEVGGVQLWTIDTKAVEKLAKAGVQIPGVTLTEVTVTAAKG